MRIIDKQNHDHNNMTFVDVVANHLDDYLIPLMGVTTLSIVMYQKNHPLISLFTFSFMGVMSYICYLVLTFVLNYIAKKVMDVLWAALSIYAEKKWFQFRVWLRKKLG